MPSVKSRIQNYRPLGTVTPRALLAAVSKHRGPILGSRGIYPTSRGRNSRTRMSGLRCPGRLVCSDSRGTLRPRKPQGDLPGITGSMSSQCSGQRLSVPQPFASPCSVPRSTGLPHPRSLLRQIKVCAREEWYEHREPPSCTRLQTEESTGLMWPFLLHLRVF